VPEAGAWGPDEAALIDRLGEGLQSYEATMDAIEVRKSAAELRALWAMGNEYLQAAAPWSIYKEDPDRAAAIVRMALNLIRFYAVISAPFIPDAAARMLSSMNTLDMDWPKDVGEALSALPAGHAFVVPDVLFRKIADDERVDWQTRFAGVRS
jgi:methionyl-tRNA synthetase